jgi:hypothetical protein
MTHSDQAAQFDQTEMCELNADELELVTGGMFNFRELVARVEASKPVLFGANKSANKPR